jgi:hypothetical protein
MLFALIGSIVGQLTLSAWHDRQLSRLTSTPGAAKAEARLG